MDRLFRFLRSVIPQDPTQLLFLVGSILLFICIQLRCFPITPSSDSAANTIPGFSLDDPLESVRRSWLIFSSIARLPILFAGAAGLFICFWPGRRPVRRSLIFVCLPAIAGLAVLCTRFLSTAADWGLAPKSVLSHPSYSQIWVFKTLWSLGPALHMSVLGVLLIFIFLSRQAFGLSSLPLALPHVNGSTPNGDGGWRRIEIFVWISIPGLIVVNILVSAPLLGLNFAHLGSSFIQVLDQVTGALRVLILACVAAWAIGDQCWKKLERFIRLPEISLAMLGFAIPVGISLVPNLIGYTKDRIQWGIHGYGRFSPPIFAAYFNFPDLIYLWFFPAACLEELIWRGFLQPRFVERYGTMRGIFMIGLSWSAFHFIGDFAGLSDDFEIPLQLALRIGGCLAMSFVLGWLVMRTGSIWPGVLVHGVYNVLVLSQSSGTSNLSPLISRMVLCICYGLLGYMLFKYWPLKRADVDPAIGALDQETREINLSSYE